MDIFTIAFDETVMLQVVLTAVPLVSTLAGFLISLGEAAYYRIMTELGAPSLQSFALRFVVIGFLTFMLIYFAFCFSAASLILLVMAIVCILAAVPILYSLRKEIAVPEFLLVLVTMLVLLIASLYLGSSGDPLSYSMAEEKSVKVHLSLTWMVLYFVLSCGLFYESGFYLARLRKIYLVDNAFSKIVLTTCAGGNAFVRSIDFIDEDCCYTAQDFTFVLSSDLGACKWKKFSKVVMRPELDVIDCGLKKVLFHSGGQSFIYRSGVGKAKHLQIKSLECVRGKETKIIGHREDVLHINTAGIGGYVLMARSHKRGIPVVTTAHNLAEILPGTFKFLQSSFAVGIYKWWLKKFYSFADVVIAPTNYVSKKLSQEYGVTSSMEIISNGVDIKAFESVSDACKIKALKHIFADRYFDLCSGISSRHPIVLAVGM